MRTSKLLIALAAMAVLAGCDVKDPIYDTDHPDKGKITLTTNWTKRTAGADIPQSYTARVGDKTAVLSGSTNALPDLFAPGSYTLYIYHDTDKMTVSGTTATVSSTSGVVDPMPGWLFTTKKTVTVAAGQTQTVTVEMKQEVCQLDIELTVTEGDPARITKVEGTLAGVAAAWDFDTDTPVGDAAKVQSEFTKSGDKITATMRLLGIVPATPQELTLTVTFSDNSTQTITKDLSSLLTDFNADQHIAVKITADVKTPSEMELTATISGWELGKVESGSAE